MKLVKTGNLFKIDIDNLNGNIVLLYDYCGILEVSHNINKLFDNTTKIYTIIPTACFNVALKLKYGEEENKFKYLQSLKNNNLEYAQITIEYIKNREYYSFMKLLEYFRNKGYSTLLKYRAEYLRFTCEYCGSIKLCKNYYDIKDCCDCSMFIEIEDSSDIDRYVENHQIQFINTNFENKIIVAFGNPYPYMSYFELYIKINNNSCVIYPSKSDFITRYDYDNYEKDCDKYSVNHIQIVTEDRITELRIENFDTFYLKN